MTNKWVVAALVLAALAAGYAVGRLDLIRPNTTDVSKSQQDHWHGNPFTVQVWVAPREIVNSFCAAESDIGCVSWTDVRRTEARVFIDENYSDVEWALEHEFAHLVYGPKHRGE